ELDRPLLAGDLEAALRIDLVERQVVALLVEPTDPRLGTGERQRRADHDLVAVRRTRRLRLASPEDHESPESRERDHRWQEAIRDAHGVHRRWRTTGSSRRSRQ